MGARRAPVVRSVDAAVKVRALGLARLLAGAAVRLAVGALCFAAMAGPASAQTIACDPGLEQPAANPLGYRLREDRCEGVYAQPVASTRLAVASLIESFEPLDLRSTPHLDVRWTAPGSQEIHLRATGLRRRLYYRMDARRPAASSSYIWPTDLLAALDIPRAELGLLAWTREQVGGVERDVHLPLRIGGERPGGRADAYSLVLFPEIALTEVYVSLARVGGDGRAETFIRDEAPLGYNYYPAERPIEVALARPAAPGIYYLLIGAGIRGGGSLATEFWFHVPTE